MATTVKKLRNYCDYFKIVALFEQVKSVIREASVRICLYYAFFVIITVNASHSELYPHSTTPDVKIPRNRKLKNMSMTES